MAVSKHWGPFFGSPYNKSPTIWGSILGPLIFGISHVSLRLPAVGTPGSGGSGWPADVAGPGLDVTRHYPFVGSLLPRRYL